MPLTVRLSFARTWTPRPATTLPWIEAEVPAGTTDASASLATLPVGAALVIVDFGLVSALATRSFVFASEALFSCQFVRSWAGSTARRDVLPRRVGLAAEGDLVVLRVRWPETQAGAGPDDGALAPLRMLL